MRSCITVVVACFVQIAVVSGCGRAPDAVDDNAAAQTIRTAMDEGVLHGAAAIIGRSDDVIRIFDGLSVEPGGEPIDENSVFRLASLTKVFTQLAILRLCDQGKVDLDAPLSLYRPGLDADWADDVTVRQLLAFRSGLPREPGPDAPGAGVVLGADGMALTHLDALVSPGPETEPGSRMTYSNLGYFHLGGVIEQVTGRTYADAVEHLVCRPAGLEDTGFGADVIGVGRHVQGHDTHSDGSFEAVEGFPVSSRYAAGGMHSTLSDMEDVSRAIIGGQLLSAGSMDELFTQFGRDGDSSDFRAMGHVPGFGNVWHLGRQPAFAVISLNNAVPGTPAELIPVIDEAVDALTGAAAARGNSLPPANEDWTRAATFDAIPDRALVPVVRAYCESFASGDLDEVYEALCALHGIDESTFDEDDRKDLRASARYELDTFNTFGPFQLVAWRNGPREALQIWLRGPNGRAVRYSFEPDSEDASVVSAKQHGTIGFRPD